MLARGVHLAGVGAQYVVIHTRWKQTEKKKKKKKKKKLLPIRIDG